MNRKGLNVFYGLLGLLGLMACAQINELTGGSDDEFAPAIDSAKTYPSNGQTNFQGDEVHLKFNEYISLVKPNDNILITPRPAVNPTFEAHNKTLRILFNEPLLENTTYTLNFNGAVTDITEKNDSVFQYVFSTGDYIDSLSIRGKVTDAFMNTPVSGALVALYPEGYDISFDSIPFKVKPTYIAQTDKSGNYKLNYLKYGVYSVFAFEDLNKNLLLDPSERLAFLPEKTILVNSQNQMLDLKLYAPEHDQVMLKKTTFSSPGKLEFIFQGIPDTFAIQTSCELLKEETGKQDSLVFWLADPPVPKMRFFVLIDTLADTLKPIYKTKAEETRQLTFTTNIKQEKLLPDEDLRITFSEPVWIDESGTGFYALSQDSTIMPVEWKMENQRYLIVTNRHDSPVTIHLDSAVVKSIYGIENSQPINIKFSHHPLNYFGSLIVNTDTTFSQPCLVYLLNSDGISVDTVTFSKQMKFENLPPGDYQLRLVIDEDGNGEWTTGSLPLGRIPEKVIYFHETMTVKSKWEKEVDWILTTFSN